MEQPLLYSLPSFLGCKLFQDGSIRAPLKNLTAHFWHFLFYNIGASCHGACFMDCALPLVCLLCHKNTPRWQRFLHSRLNSVQRVVNNGNSPMSKLVLMSMLCRKAAHSRVDVKTVLKLRTVWTTMMFSLHKESCFVSDYTYYLVFNMRLKNVFLISGFSRG